MRQLRSFHPALQIIGVLLIIFLPVLLLSTQARQELRQHAANITGDVTVDFSNRQSTAHPINSHFAGMNGFNKIQTDTQILGYLAPAHFDLMRVSVDMVATFPSSTQQNWSSFDTMMNSIASQNLHPILTIGYTPNWLQPSSNPCGTGSSHVMPTSAQAWGQLAAAVVAHMDKTFPTVHPEYEIWNEPDGTTFMCVPTSDPNPDQTRLSEYKQIYAAAAPLMKQQAQKDSVTIHVGGPALAVPKARASLWFPALVSDPTIAPYLDFMTYHDYQNGGAPGDTWATFLAGTQNTTTGQAAIFEQISKYVRAGIQPNASQTPIYEDEYNTNTGLPNSARNDPTYAPLWNSLIITDLLNSVNDTSSLYGPAQQPIAGFAYFVSTQPPPGNEFCLFGTVNSTMDCTAGNTPYPQYYAYQLFSDPQYLDITNQGYVVTANTTKPNLAVTAFYTKTKDTIVIVNTGSTAYANLTVTIANPGQVTTTTATVLTLNQANPKITSSQTTIQQSTNEYTSTITIPPYTTVGLSLTSSGNGGTPFPTTQPSISNTPSVTNNPSITNPPGGTNFSVTVCPHGLGNCGDNVNPNSGGNTSPKHTSRNVTLTIFDSNNQQTATGKGSISYNTSSKDFQGYISIPNLTSGRYLVSVKMDEFLSKQISGIITVTQGQTMTLPSVSLVTGDINNDNQLDLQDYNILISCFGSKQSTSSCLQPPTTTSAGADINDDGTVDGVDYNEFLRELSVQKGL